jgi:hypothetical protein
MFGFLFSAGTIVGSFLGGALASPASQYPDIFGSFPFLIEFPFFLPLASSSLISIVGIITAILWLPETLKRDNENEEATENPPAYDQPSHEDSMDSLSSPTSPNEPVGLKRARSSVSLHSPFAGFFRRKRRPTCEEEEELSHLFANEEGIDGDDSLAETLPGTPAKEYSIWDSALPIACVSNISHSNF